MITALCPLGFQFLPFLAFCHNFLLLSHLVSSALALLAPFSSSDSPCMPLPQGLCTYCFQCWGITFSRYHHDWLSLLWHTSARVLPSQRRLFRRPPTYSLPPLPGLIFFPHSPVYILVSCGWETKYQRCSGLKQSNVSSHSWIGWKSIRLGYFLCPPSHQAEIKVSAAWGLLSGRLRMRIHFQACSGCRQNSELRLRSFFSSRLLAQVCAQLLEATHILELVAPSPSEPAKADWIPLRLHLFCLSSLLLRILVITLGPLG